MGFTRSSSFQIVRYLFSRGTVSICTISPGQKLIKCTHALAKEDCSARVLEEEPGVCGSLFSVGFALGLGWSHSASERPQAELQVRRGLCGDASPWRSAAPGQPDTVPGTPVTESFGLSRPLLPPSLPHCIQKANIWSPFSNVTFQFCCLVLLRKGNEIFFISERIFSFFYLTRLLVQGTK